MNKESLIIAASLVNTRLFLLMKSVELISMDINHCFLTEVRDGNLVKIDSKDINIKRASSLGRVLYFSSTHDLLFMDLKKSNECESIKLDENLLIHQLKQAAGSIYILTIDGKVFSINSNSNKLDSESLGIEGDMLLNDIYVDSKISLAVGIRGTAWLKGSNTNQWVSEDLGTNKNLTCITKSKEHFYIAGMNGSIFFGNEGEWQPIHHDFNNIDIWDITYYKKEIYFLCSRGVFRIEKDNEIAVVMERNQKNGVFYSFSQDETYLLAIGEKCIVSFDGEEWKDIINMSKS